MSTIDKSVQPHNTFEEVAKVGVPFIAHEKSPGEELERWQVKQRIRQYKKRYAHHYQKAQAMRKAGKQVPARTLAAIENNRQWIEYHKALLLV